MRKFKAGDRVIIKSNLKSKPGKKGVVNYSMSGGLYNVSPIKTFFSSNTVVFNCLQRLTLCVVRT